MIVVLKEEINKSLKATHESTNNWRKLINSLKESQETQEKQRGEGND